MERITNVRISTQTKIIANGSDINVSSVYLSGGHIIVKDVEGNAYGSVCGCDTSRANVIANLLRGVDGKDGKDGKDVDMSDYYDKETIEDKLSHKQDEISDLETIRSGAALGATSLQQSHIEYLKEVYISEDTLERLLSGQYQVDFASLLDAIRREKIIRVCNEAGKFYTALAYDTNGAEWIILQITDINTVYSIRIERDSANQDKGNVTNVITKELAFTEDVDAKIAESSDVYIMDINLSALTNDQDVTFDFASLQSAMNKGKVILIEDPVNPKGMFMVSASQKDNTIVMKVNYLTAYITATARDNQDGTGIIPAHSKGHKTYATEAYVTNIVGDINTLLESIIAG